MSAQAFSEMAEVYAAQSKADLAAGERLLDLLAIGPKDFVLDLGCGVGALTKAIRARTRGKVTALDQSAGMIAKARWTQGLTDVTFLVGEAEEMTFERNFNVVVCNSALHWFARPGHVLDRAFAALRSGGWLGIQAPATQGWSSLVSAVQVAASEDPRTARTFQRYRPPYFLLSTEKDYERFVESVGFSVHDAAFVTSIMGYDPKEAMDLLATQAGAGLFHGRSYEPNQAGGPPSEAFFHDLWAVAKEVVEQSLDDQGQLQVVTVRLYLLAVKPLHSPSV